MKLDCVDKELVRTLPLYEALESIKQSFEFENCGECGGEFGDHEACIGPFGMPFLRCRKNTDYKE